MDVNSKLILQAKRKSAIGDDKPKKKSRKYSDTYLDFGFTFILQNSEEKPQCVICNKYWPVRVCYRTNLNDI